MAADASASSGLTLKTRVLQVILGVLLASAAGFLFALAVPRVVGQPLDGKLGLLDGLAAGLGMAIVALHRVVGRLVEWAGLWRLQIGQPLGAVEPPSAAALFGVFQSRVIVEAALLEAAAMLAGVLAMLGSSWLELGTGLVLLVPLALLVPRAGKVEAWIEDRLGQFDKTRRSTR